MVSEFSTSTVSKRNKSYFTRISLVINENKSGSERKNDQNKETLTNSKFHDHEADLLEL